MKYILLLLLFTPLLTFYQSKKDIEIELKNTKAKLDSIQLLFYQQQTFYQQRITSFEATIDKIKFLVGPPLKNIRAEVNLVSDLENQGGAVPNQLNQVKLGEGDGLTPKTGAKIYTGSNGVQYYINKNGNKTYIRKKN